MTYYLTVIYTQGKEMLSSVLNACIPTGNIRVFTERNGRRESPLLPMHRPMELAGPSKVESSDFILTQNTAPRPANLSEECRSQILFTIVAFAALSLITSCSYLIDQPAYKYPCTSQHEQSTTASRTIFIFSLTAVLVSCLELVAQYYAPSSESLTPRESPIPPDYLTALKSPPAYLQSQNTFEVTEALPDYASVYA